MQEFRYLLKKFENFWMHSYVNNDLIFKWNSLNCIWRAVSYVVILMYYRLFDVI